MPLLTPGPSRLLGGGARLDWWLAGGTIPLANVLEHVENPTARQLYAGADATGAWTIALRTNLLIAPTAGQTAFAFDTQTGRTAIGYGGGPLVLGALIGGPWVFDGLIATGDHTAMLVSDGTNIRAYRNNVEIGTASASGNDISGATRWRSRHIDLTGVWYDWPVEIPRGLVANIALDATQRAALHTSLMA